MFIFKYFHLIKSLTLILVLALLLNGCGLYKKTNTRETPINALERAKKNVAEGRGISLKKALGGRNSGTFQFSSSNPMWRASLDTLDFIPLSTVDYSGGVIITDWYSDSVNSNETLKISLRFLSNEIMSNSFKVTVHQKTCSTQNRCAVKLLKSKIEIELKKTILSKALEMKKNDKKKK
tara:strand:- start:466 stop:1002 length:537 start_codon:yes stop_codon:yes gene_type:complete